MCCSSRPCGSTVALRSGPASDQTPLQADLARKNKVSKLQTFKVAKSFLNLETSETLKPRPQILTLNKVPQSAAHSPATEYLRASAAPLRGPCNSRDRCPTTPAPVDGWQIPSRFRESKSYGCSRVSESPRPRPLHTKEC